MADRAVFVDVDVFYPVLAEIARGPEVYAFVRRLVDDAAETLRRNAPVRTGAGRGSIRAEVHMGPDGWYGTASWDESHYYMGILNASQKWADRAAAQVRYV